MRQTILVFLTIALAAGMARAQETSALINDALDKPLSLGEFKKKIPEIIDDIQTKTGVQFKYDSAVWELLPWGRDTQIGGTMNNTTPREAMTTITRKAGLTFAVRDEYVEIQPTPALRRLGQRANPSELHALDILGTKELELDTTRPTIKRLLEAVDDRLASIKDKEQYAIENRMGDAPELGKQVFVPRNATLMDALESIPKETHFTWYPWGKSILIVSKEERTLRLLSKRLSVPEAENGTDVLQLLVAISKQTGVPFIYQPGVIQSLPADAKILRARGLDNNDAMSILEAIMGATGLTYTVQDDKVQIRSGGAAGAAPARDPAMGMLQLDNGMTVLVPTSQVPPDIREYLKVKTEREWKKIRKQMEEEGFKPTTQPAE